MAFKIKPITGAVTKSLGTEHDGLLKKAIESIRERQGGSLWNLAKDRTGKRSLFDLVKSQVAAGASPSDIFVPPTGGDVMPTMIKAQDLPINRYAMTNLGDLTELETGSAMSRAIHGEATNEDRLVREALRMIAGQRMPSAEDLQLRLDRAVELGEITPIEAQQIMADASAYEGLQADPEMVAQQQAVLSKLGEISEGGLTSQDRARLSQIASEEAQRERGAREAIIQSAAQQGRAGGGLDLMQRLMSQQEGAGRRAQRGMDVEALAQQRALEALMQQGELAGEMRGQKFGEQERVAQAKQAIQQFNIANMLAQQEANIGRKMATQEANLAERQRVQQANIQQQAAEAARRAEIPEKQFEMGMKQRLPASEILAGHAGALGSAREAAANRAFQASEGKKERKSNLIGGLISGGAAVLGGFLSDEEAKENIQPVDKFDVDNFLNSLTGYKYNYKGDDQSTGGVLAQDLERTAMGEGMVSDTPVGKMVDAEKLIGGLTASTANLNERLKKLERK